jgi:MFS transporter, putative metabolite:H+ symporter
MAGSLLTPTTFGVGTAIMWQVSTEASTAPGPHAQASIADRLDRLPPSRWHRRVTTLVGLGSFFNLFEVAAGGSLAALLTTSWTLSTWDKSATIGALFVGEMIGSLALSPLADRLGRRTLFQLNLLIYGGLSLATALSPNLAVFLVLRVLTGVGLGAEMTLVDTYLSELVPAARRGRYLAWAYTLGMSAFPVGGAAARLADGSWLGIAGWRWMLAVFACAGLLVWVTRRRLPESPRWLATHGDVPAADRVVTDIEKAVGAQAAASGAGAPIASRGLSRPSGRYRGRRLLMWVMWILQPIGFYGFASLAPIVLLAKGFDLQHSLAYAALTALGYPVGSLLSVSLTERVERRSLLIASTLASAVFGVSFGAATTAALVVAFGVAVTISNVINSNSIHTYQAELFHTAERSTSIGPPYAASRLVGAVLPAAALCALTAIGPAGVYACCAVFLMAMAVAVRVLGPRTNHRQLDYI